MPSVTKSRTVEDRQARLLKEMPNSKSIAEAMRKAGYSPKTAHKQPTVTLNRAIDAVTKRAASGDKEAERLLAVIGIGEEELTERLKYIALKSNQHSVSVALLTPILKQRGYNIDGNGSDTKTQINIIVAPRSITTPNIYEIEAAELTPIAPSNDPLDGST